MGRGLEPYLHSLELQIQEEEEKNQYSSITFCLCFFFFFSLSLSSLPPSLSEGLLFPWIFFIYSYSKQYFKSTKAHLYQNAFHHYLSNHFAHFKIYFKFEKQSGSLSMESSRTTSFMHLFIFFSIHLLLIKKNGRKRKEMPSSFLHKMIPFSYR